MLAVAAGAGEQEVGGDGDGDREDEEHGPGEAGGPRVGLVHAHPPEVGPEALQLVLRVRGAARELDAPVAAAAAAVAADQSLSVVCHGGWRRGTGRLSSSEEAGGDKTKVQIRSFGSE